MGILETISVFFGALLCFGGCYGFNRKFYEQEEAIRRLERNEVPPEYTENSEPAPPYEQSESTPILIPQADQRQH